MPQVLKTRTYIRVVNLPYSNHSLAKEMLNKAVAEIKAQAKDAKKMAAVKIPLNKFTTNDLRSNTQRRTLRGLFIYTASQMPWYCPTDKVTIKLGKTTLTLHYTQNQQYYKGIEEL